MNWCIVPMKMVEKPYRREDMFMSFFDSEREAFDAAVNLSEYEGCQVDVCVVIGKVYPKTVIERYAQDAQEGR